MTEHANFTHFPLGKLFEKQIKIIEDQGRKQINAIINQNRRLAALTNKDDHKGNYKEIFEKLGKERFAKVNQLTDEINHKICLMCYLKGNTARKRFDGFNNSIELFRKIQSGETKLVESKNFRMCLNQI